MGVQYLIKALALSQSQETAPVAAERLPTQY
jgi:hypothetical protein